MMPGPVEVEPAVQIAVAALLASVVSVTLTAAILADDARRHVFAGAAGLVAGVVLQAWPDGRVVVAPWVDALPSWIGQPFVTVLCALGFSAIVNGLLSSSLPVIGGLRARGRRALRASRWGTPEELSEQTHLDPGVIRVLGFGVEHTPLSVSRRLAQLRIAAMVVCGSCLGLFCVIGVFRQALYDTFTWSHAGINLIATALVTFFIGPLHEAVMHLAADSHGADAGTPASPKLHDHRPLGHLIGIFILVAALLFVIQALHSAAHAAIQKIDVSKWILLLEGCALPLIVTTYYFGAALYREELGDRRWDRALGASVWFGAIVLLPFATALLLSDRAAPDLRDSLVSGFLPEGLRLGHRLVLGLMLAYAAALAAIVVSIVLSWVTYGIYALALGLAMTGATRAKALIRAPGAIALTGVLLQIVTLAIVGWPEPADPKAPTPRDLLEFVPIFLTAGWAIGLALSRFDREMKVPAK